MLTTYEIASAVQFIYHLLIFFLACMHKKPIEANKSLYVVTAKRCQQAITKKAVRLGLEVVVTEPSVSTTTIKIKLPKETPNVEDTSKLLAGISSSKFPILESNASRQILSASRHSEISHVNNYQIVV